MKPSLDSLEAIATHIGDTDAEWWPFQFLRPEQHQRLSTARCLVIAVLQGIPTALLALIVGRLVGDSVNGMDLVLFPLAISLVFFALFRSTFAVFWNRRADRLRPAFERRSEWKRASVHDRDHRS